MSFVTCCAGGVVYTAADSLGPGVRCAFSTRLGGVSGGPFESLNLGRKRGDDPEKVAENFRRWCAAAGFDFDRMVFARQVHGTAVRVCTAGDAGIGLVRENDLECDALVTDVPGLTLVVFHADCIPVLLHDPVRRAVGAVHAGWRGTASGAVTAAVEAMRAAYGTDLADLRAAVGPGICRACFETRADVPDTVRSYLGGAADACIDEHGDGTFRVDLKGINVLRLLRAGVPEKNIDVSSDCTCHQSPLYWSHRLLGDARGSQASAICLL